MRVISTCLMLSPTTKPTHARTHTGRQSNSVLLLHEGPPPHKSYTLVSPPLDGMP